MVEVFKHKTNGEVISVLRAPDGGKIEGCSYAEGDMIIVDPEGRQIGAMGKDFFTQNFEPFIEEAIEKIEPPTKIEKAIDVLFPPAE